MQNPITNIIFDFDSTIVQLETLDELAKIVLAETPDAEARANEIASITTQGMNGEIGFAESLERRLSKIMPTKADISTIQAVLVDAVSPSFMRYRERIQMHADNIWIVSGGFTELIVPVAKLFGIDPSHVFANDFTWDDNERATGYDRKKPLAQDGGKIIAVRSLNLDPESTCIVGDGMTDYALRAAGLAGTFIAYTETCHRDAVVEQADIVAESFEEVAAKLGW